MLRIIESENEHNLLIVKKQLLFPLVMQSPAILANGKKSLKYLTIRMTIEKRPYKLQNVSFKHSLRLLCGSETNCKGDWYGL